MQSCFKPSICAFRWIRTPFYPLPSRTCTPFLDQFIPELQMLFTLQVPLTTLITIANPHSDCDWVAVHDPFYLIFHVSRSIPGGYGGGFTLPVPVINRFSKVHMKYAVPFHLFGELLAVSHLVNYLQDLEILGAKSFPAPGCFHSILLVLSSTPVPSARLGSSDLCSSACSFSLSCAISEYARA